MRIGEVNPQPRLEPTRKVCELLGDPQRSAPVVHITGTNGKTSTSRMIEAILRASGLKTGLLTSPHLVSVNERIVIDGIPVSNEAFVRNYRDIEPYLTIVDAELIANGEEALSYFEALTVLGFAVFADAPVDVMVLEVGMGGEWDSTNVADGQVAVFTPIALDHQARLGNTIAEIARTKGGIIKPAAAVVSAMQPIEALDELRVGGRARRGDPRDRDGRLRARVDDGRGRWSGHHGARAAPAGTRNSSSRSTATTRVRTRPSRSRRSSRSSAAEPFRSATTCSPKGSRTRPHPAASS